MLISGSAERLQSASGFLDGLAVLLSGLCLVHCLALPALTVLLPFVSAELLADERLHLWLLAAVLPTSFAALTYGWQLHRHHRLLLLGGGALALIASAAFGRQFGWLGESGDRWLSVCGGLLLASAHLRNFALLHRRHAHDPLSGRCQLPAAHDSQP